MLRELSDGRKVEELRQVHLAGVLAVDLLVDLDELQRARADLEQVIVDVDALALQSRVADALELVLDRGARADLRSLLRGAQRRGLPQLRVELAVGVALFQQVALNLAAGGLGDALHRYDLGHLEPGLLVDEPRYLARERQEVLERAAVQYEHDQLLDLRSARAHAGRDHLAELQARRPLRDGLEIVRVVVLAVDEDDFLGAAGDVELTRVYQAEVPGAQPAIGSKRRGVGLAVLVVAARDVVAADVDVAGALSRELTILIVRDAHAAVRDRPPLGHELHRVAVRGAHR